MDTTEGFKHQDWNEVILKKPIPIKQNKGERKINNNNNNEEEIQAPPKSVQEIRIAIQQARIAKNFSQKQLASLMNISIQHIGQFENGKMAPSNAMIAKLERLLNVKLPRNKK